jgi:hypothetical protein
MGRKFYGEGARMRRGPITFMAALLLAGCTSQPSPAPNPDAVGQCQSSTGSATVDASSLELPSQVSSRARHVLGQRYVDTAITKDQRCYVIGVLNLTAQETPTLTAELTADAPIKLVNRTVSLAAVNRLFAQAKQAITTTGPAAAGVTISNTDPSRGTVVVTVPSRKYFVKASHTLLPLLPGGTKQLRPDGTMVLAPDGNSPSDPTITVTASTAHVLDGSSA